MSKGADLLIGKAEVLAKGLRKKVSELTAYGIDAAAVDRLETEIERLRQTDAETEAQLAILNRKREANTEARITLYEDVQALKHIVKTEFDKTDWHLYGVEDKQ